MSASRSRVLLVHNERIGAAYMMPSDLERLETFADWERLVCEGGTDVAANEDPASIARLLDRVGDFNGIVVLRGAPRISAEMMDRAPKLRIIGDIEGDRFASRIDLQAAWERRIRTVDTTHGSSFPVAEWALALILLSLRNGGAHFRRMIAGDGSKPPRDDPSYLNGELTGKRVGLIGCGHIGQRLIKFLRPFEVDIRVYDPYLPREMADALGFLETSLDYVLSQSDVIVCLTPLTPMTRGMIGQRELDLIPSGAVLVNVSRGAVIDSDALILRLKRGDIIAGLDVFDPEPVSAECEVIHLPNVFLSPHIAGVTAAGHQRLFTLMVDELERFFGGHQTLFDLTPRSLANRRGDDPHSTPPSS